MPRYTTSDGLSLYFEDDGQGPPVLCLAGLTRNSR
ncbi:MAG: alpha/beta hydrolase, partial [Pseudomonadota bacterium]